jgi:hypothetical protein
MNGTYMSDQDMRLLRQLPSCHALRIVGYKIGGQESCSQDVTVDAVFSEDHRDVYVWAGHYLLAESENAKLKEAVAQAVQYLKEGKAKFAPNTDNSLVDRFIENWQPKGK